MLPKRKIKKKNTNKITAKEQKNYGVASPQFVKNCLPLKEKEKPSEFEKFFFVSEKINPIWE